MCKALNTNFIVFDLTRPELNPTIYHILDEHANHYTTDVVYDPTGAQSHYLPHSRQAC